MRICRISNTNFESKADRQRKYLSERAQGGAKELLKKMNQGTVCKESANGKGFQSDILASISMGDKIKFSDNRLYLSPTNLKEKTSPDCTLQMGKTLLYINSETGEVLYCKKGVFSFLRKVLSSAEDCIAALLENFDNPYVVKKNIFGILLKKI